jgi:hypothetical protein
MSDQPLYSHTQQDGELDRLRLRCNTCGKSVSTPFYPVKTDTPDGGLIVRGFIECPECLERKTSEASSSDQRERERATLDEAVRLLRAALMALRSYEYGNAARALAHEVAEPIDAFLVGDLLHPLEPPR